MPAPNGRKLLLLELNEISWSVIDRLISQRGADFLPHFTHLRREGTCGTPMALEQPPLLDPWVTWVTVHTGVPHDVHGARVLEQDADTISAKRSWEYAAAAGLTVGVFGSIGAFPPPPLRGFVVPGPFAPADNTHPPELAAVQRLNRTHTQAHAGGRPSDSLGSMARTGARLVHLGLRPTTCLTVLTQLLRERFDRGSSWRRVVLQPLLNFDFFAQQYRRARPDFATWHSNHAAHFMHHYWRAWDDDGFSTKGPPEERSRFGEAVPLGYKICDRLIGRFLRLIDPDTLLVVCSSMGQQPYRNAAYKDGKVIVRFKDIHRFLRLIDAAGIAEVVQTMVPQFNLRVPDREQRVLLGQRLRDARRTIGTSIFAAFAVEETGEILTVTPLAMAERREDVSYEIPGMTHALCFEDAFDMSTPTVKQGMHHPEGLFLVYGRGIARGKLLPACSNLDLAPTFLSLLGLPQPQPMRGRILVRLNA
jgi:hypothetical protein